MGINKDFTNTKVPMAQFDHTEIAKHHLHQIEYSIVDSCNKNCKSCSHFAPLAKRINEVAIDEFVRNTEILHNIIPDVHTFWLIGGEPTLHSQFLFILKELRRVYIDIPVGVMSNGYGLLTKKFDESFWSFIHDNKIIWRITTYDVDPNRYIKLFEDNGCLELLSLDINNNFTNLAVLTETEQELSYKKYDQCGWERMNIFVRNNRIWKCPTIEYIDLFNDHFQKDFKVNADDYLDIDNGLTREMILDFKGRPASFCKNCNLSKRFKHIFEATKSDRRISEWLTDD